MNTSWRALVAMALLMFQPSGVTYGMQMDFYGSTEQRLWRVTNDTVMGGRSSSSVHIETGWLHFQGILSTANNGGFTSVWRAAEYPLLTSSLPVVVSGKGDGREYQLRFRTRQAPEIAYFASFSTARDSTGRWVFNEDDFAPIWRGRKVKNAPVFRFADAVQVGLLLADKPPGEFHLQIKRITQLQGI